jgi:hypothetical protein
LTPIYAEVRQTQDFDFVIDLSMLDTMLSNLQQLFIKHKFQAFTSWKDVFTSGLMAGFITILSPIDQFKVDINLKKDSPINVYEQLADIAFPRRVRIKLGETECWAQTKEDFILAKLVYGGYQDYKDALACSLRFKESLDREYIDPLARDLGVEEYWQAVLRQSPVDSVFPE